MKALIKMGSGGGGGGGGAAAAAPAAAGAAAPAGGTAKKEVVVEEEEEEGQDFDLFSGRSIWGFLDWETLVNSPAGGRCLVGWTSGILRIIIGKSPLIQKTPHVAPRGLARQPTVA